LAPTAQNPSSAPLWVYGYEITAGKILFQGLDITSKGVDERAKLGIIVSFQNPPEITGVKLGDLLKLCLGKAASDEFSPLETAQIEAFRLTNFLNRDVNLGFSGGERKRSEILQLIFLKPKLLLLDEPDSGVDESLKMISTEIQRYVESSGASALLSLIKGGIDTSKLCACLNGQFTAPGLCESQ
jgi:Fe-S cluster assembly ATP-binding protein